MKDIPGLPISRQGINSIASPYSEQYVHTLSVEELELKEVLELQIQEGLRLSMQGFYLIGSALRQLKALKLHRNSHLRFDEYAKERFKISKRYQHYLINAVEVIDVFSNDKQYIALINGQIPEREFHCRQLLKLGNQPDIWKKAWYKSVMLASGETPTAKIVGEVVKQLQNITIEQNPFEVGDICLIAPGDNPALRGLQGCWAIIAAKNEFYCDIKTSLGLIRQISSSYLLHSAYTEEQQAQIQKIWTLVDKIPSNIKKEEIVIALLRVLGKRFLLSDIEADLLTTLLNSKC
ncbi:hypothetical protein [Gloeothece verrucosa]|uniref:Uncharacterized protein n=1 Tax=Gloeothece verrucosa (strain PCC 7822) TaxID=497965 RepID=E0UL35_GLOV7|nr:hypothetical protein [Gloeothece verrucosa]ADN17665.1 conserved hypothetical protein [Gloeothece verrucosa PCC 7822]